jgi:nitrate/TMAO reductase-like tetraheme cytochrome c subunit
MRPPASPRKGFGWLWHRPRHGYLLGLPAGALLAFLAGIGITGGFFAGLRYAETDAFCTSCHSMNTAFVEYTHSVHYANAYGIRASCGNCHVPPTFVAGMIRHVEASVEIWGFITGELDTQEKYESHRMALAQKIWRELKANDSAECRSCHRVAAMADPAAPAPGAVADAITKAAMHQSLAASYTCIDCHKGAAHALPTANPGRAGV